MEKKPNILIVDDDKFHMGRMKRSIGENATVTAMTPQELIDRNEQTFFQDIDIALIDYDFKKFTSIDMELAQFLRKMGCNSKILLCSLHKDFYGNIREVKKYYDGVLDKENLSWSILEPFLSKNLPK